MAPGPLSTQLSRLLLSARTTEALETHADTCSASQRPRKESFKIKIPNPPPLLLGGGGEPAREQTAALRKDWHGGQREPREVPATAGARG